MARGYCERRAAGTSLYAPVVVYRDGQGGTERLGPLVKVHRDRSGCVLWVILFFLSFCIVGVAAFKGLPASVGVTMFAVLLGGIVLLRWMARRRGTRRIDLHARGIVSRSPGAECTLLFDDVLRVTSGSRRSQLVRTERQTHVVEGADAVRIEFNLLFDRALDLLEAVHAGTLDRLRTEALRAYDAGQTVHFGPFEASQEGLMEGSGPIVPWSAIARATAGMRSIAIGPVWSKVEVWGKGADKPFAAHPTEQVPNARVLLQLVELAVAAEGEDEEPVVEA